MIHKIALVAAIVLPLWNIPLIMRMVKRKSSKDISLYWVFGVWGCLLLMFPSGIVSEDIVWRAFNISNILLFTCVVICALVYYRGGE
ncbi:MAG: hypothetical protein ABIH71_01025 [Candidatus Omnitrophota bacterium]|nr:hypothetical protein [Candidatus Omnitrophota bacterium]